MNITHSDRAVAKRLLSGDEAAFSEVFDSFFPRLYRYTLARIGGDQEEAKDIVQQTFCKAFERLDSYRAEASLYGWMCQICRNTMIDRARKRQTQGKPLPFNSDETGIHAIADALHTPATEQPENELARDHLLELIQATLDYLPSHYGDVLELKYVDELSVKEIAAELNMGAKATESLLTRARSAFKEAILAISDSADLLPLELKPASER